MNMQANSSRQINFARVDVQHCGRQKHKVKSIAGRMLDNAFNYADNIINSNIKFPLYCPRISCT